MKVTRHTKIKIQHIAIKIKVKKNIKLLVWLLYEFGKYDEAF